LWIYIKLADIHLSMDEPGHFWYKAPLSNSQAVSQSAGWIDAACHYHIPIQLFTLGNSIPAAIPRHVQCSIAISSAYGMRINCSIRT